MELLSLEEAKNKYIGFHNRRLTIIDIYTKPRKCKNSFYNEKIALCKCDCGTIHSFRLSDVIHDAVWSCGCLKIEAVKENIKQANIAYQINHIDKRTGNKWENIGNGIIIVYDNNHPDKKFYVDAATWLWLNRFTWNVSTNGYVYTSIDYHQIPYHGIILCCPPNYVRDHIDRNRSNNLYSNLRVTTFRGNMINRDYGDNPGVYYQKRKWIVNARKPNGETIYESFNTKQEAIQRRKDIENQYYIIESLDTPKLILPNGSLNYLNFRFDWYPIKYDAVWKFLGINVLPWLNKNLREYGTQKIQ